MALTLLGFRCCSVIVAGVFCTRRRQQLMFVIYFYTTFVFMWGGVDLQSMLQSLTVPFSAEDEAPWKLSDLEAADEIMTDV